MHDHLTGTQRLGYWLGSFAIIILCGHAIWDGFRTGTTMGVGPMRGVDRRQEPGAFWVHIAFYAVFIFVGLGMIAQLILDPAL